MDGSSGRHYWTQLMEGFNGRHTLAVHGLEELLFCCLQKGSSSPTTHRKLHVDTLILIPIFKIYVFLYSSLTNGQTDRLTEKLIWCGLGNLIGSSRIIDASNGQH